MTQASVSDVQRKMNELIMPNVLAGEEIEVIDKKTGEVKFRILPPRSHSDEVAWDDFSDRLIKVKGKSEDPVGDALDAVRADGVFL
jgi:hypothetical protein